MLSLSTNLPVRRQALPCRVSDGGDRPSATARLQRRAGGRRWQRGFAGVLTMARLSMVCRLSIPRFALISPWPQPEWACLFGPIAGREPAVMLGGIDEAGDFLFRQAAHQFGRAAGPEFARFHPFAGGDHG